MRCVDCEQHDYVIGTHFCNYKGKSGRRKPRRIREEDAYKDVPCEYIEEKGAANEADNQKDQDRATAYLMQIISAIRSGDDIEMLQSLDAVAELAYIIGGIPMMEVLKDGWV